MFRIEIQGLKDGDYPVEMSYPVSVIPDMFPEFIGNIVLSGVLKRFGKQFTFKGKVTGEALLVCDYSLKEYTEKIEKEFKATAMTDNLQYKSKDVKSDNEEIIIHEEDKYIDMTDIIREELGVSLPLKRISPEYADKNFEDLFPDYSEKIEVNSSFGALLDDKL